MIMVARRNNAQMRQHQGRTGWLATRLHKRRPPQRDDSLPRRGILGPPDRQPNETWQGDGIRPFVDPGIQPRIEIADLEHLDVREQGSERGRLAADVVLPLDFSLKSNRGVALVIRLQAQGDEIFAGRIARE